MAETAAYKEWLASAPTNQAVIETLQASHPAWGDFYIANWDRGFSGTLEDGSTVVEFQAGRFYMEPASTDDSTQQATSVTISSLEGALYQIFKDMTADDRDTPITVTHRIYLHDNPNTVQINPPPVWTLHTVQATHDTLAGELRSVPLRIQRVGVYYTQNEFPVLVYASST